MPELRMDVDVSYWLSRLAAAETAIANLSGLNRAIAEVILNAVRRNFDTTGDGKWPPLKLATLLARAGERGKVWKRVKGGGRGLTAGATRTIAAAKPLIKSAAGLYATLAPEAGPDFAQAGSNLRYAAHQFYGSKPEWRFNIPARNPLYLHSEDEREIGRMYEGFFAGPFQ